MQLRNGLGRFWEQQTGRQPWVFRVASERIGIHANRLLIAERAADM